MADFQQNFLASLHGGTDFGQRMKGIGDQSKLNQLAAQSYSTPPDQRDSLLAQMAGVDAGAAFQAEKQMAYSDERRNTNMVNMAKLLTNAPPQARAGLYRSMVPTLSRFGLSEMPQEYNDQTAPIIDKAAQSIVQAYQGQGGGMLQSQKIGADGFIYNTFRDGRMVNTGVKADRQAWFRDQEGFAPEIVNKDGTTTQIGGLSAGPQGTTFTTSEGQPFDVSQVTDPNLRQEIMRDPGSYGMVPSGTRATLPPTNVSPAQFASRTRPSAAQSAADSARAKIEVENSNFENEFEQQRRLKEQEARIDTEKARGIEQVKSEQERASNERAKGAQLNSVDRGLTRIDAALKALSGRLVDTGPVDGRLMVSTPQGQELEAAVGAIQNDMLALTRVPGIGSQSDLEAKIANLKYPSIYNHPSVNAANVQQLKAFMGDLRSQITGSPAQGGRTVVRTGTSNGRKVIQYSDGSVEYGN